MLKILQTASLVILCNVLLVSQVYAQQNESNVFTSTDLLYTQDFTGFVGSSGTLPLGFTAPTGTFQGSSSASNPTPGGFYNFTAVPGAPAIGIQPNGSFFNSDTAGYVQLQLVNNTGSTINSVQVAYDVFIRNNETRSNSLNLSFATNSSGNTPGTFTPVTGATRTSTAAVDASPAFNAATPVSVALSNLAIPNNGSLFLRITGADVSGSGSRDEFAFDNVQVVAPEPGPVILFGTAMLGLLLGRRRRNSVMDSLYWRLILRRRQAA